MYGCESLDHKEDWVLKNWWFWTVVLEKTFESPLDGKEIQPVHPKGNQSRIFIGRTDAEAEATWCEKLTYWKRPCDAEKDLRTGGEVDDRAWDGWMASLAKWTWVWANSRRQWSVGKLVCCGPQSCSRTRLGDWTTAACKYLSVQMVLLLQLEKTCVQQSGASVPWGRCSATRHFFKGFCLAQWCMYLLWKTLSQSNLKVL